jgi:hypothetical protein
VPSLIEWLRQLDAHVLRLLVLDKPTTPSEVLAALLGGVGLVALLSAALLLADHELLQRGMVAIGLLLGVPFLQNGWDAAVRRQR